MSNASDFVIENGVLKNYVGPGGDVVIPSGVTRIAMEAFQMCRTIDAVKLPDGMKEIGQAAFRGSSITKIDFPEGIEIGYSAFEDCKSLKEIRLPSGLDVLSACTFTHCVGLESIVLPDSLTVIENSVFQGCSALHSIVFPENLEEIGQQCFDQCSALEKIVLPDSLKVIDGGAFARCSNLNQLDCCDRVFRLFLDSCNTKNLLATTYAYLAGKLITPAKPADVFAKYVKRNTAKLIPLILADDCAAALDSMVRIGGPIDKKVLNTLEETTLAAQNTPSVTAWLLQYKAQTADPVKAAAEAKDQLDKALGLKKMTAADWKNIYQVKSVDAEQVQLGKYSGTDTVVAIPDMIGKKKVTILSGTFDGYAQLQEVQLPDTITEISRGAFYGCTQLQEVTLPKKLKTLGGSAFGNCTSLIQIEIPKSVAVLGAGGFENCVQLHKITLSPKIKKIPMNAFAGCTALTEITLPEKCREIEFFAFNRCWNLQAVHIGADVKSIGYEAFDNCPSVTIYAPAGSYAETWAKEHNIPFVAE